MKILFCSQASPIKELGGPKVVVELAEEMELLGWECTVLGPGEIKAALPGVSDKLSIQEYLRLYLQRHAAEYDVVDYDHFNLPFPRSEFSPNTLFVARSVILAHHIMTMQAPSIKRLLPRMKSLLMQNHLRHQKQTWRKRATYTLEQADLVNVCNYDEKATLVRLGVSEAKIVVLPFGISQSRRKLFDAISSKPPKYPVVAFVGSFDYRKGATHFHRIVERVVAQVPDARFRLLGTKGLFQTKKEVLAHFPRHLRDYMEVIPTFQSQELPALLKDCSVGVFPSHMEGFGFGVLEMLAASVPVFAYDVPGPRMMLPQDFLVPCGDTVTMGKKIAHLLLSPDQLASARLSAEQSSQQFNWADIAQATDIAYRKSSTSCILIL